MNANLPHSQLAAMRLAALVLSVLALSLGTRGAAAQGDAQVGPTLPPMPYFKLQVVSAPGHGRCLEANGLSPTSVLRGATFLDRCQNVTGQAWLAEPSDDGRFRLLSWLHATTRCLAINRGEVADIPVDAPFMAPCGTGSAVFETVVDGDGRGFGLATTLEGRRLCLTAKAPEDAAGAYMPVSAAPCDGTGAQVWIVVGGRLVDGVPVALREAAPPHEAPNGASASTVERAECLWNDGAGDRPEYYACRVERTADDSRIVVSGPDHVHSLTVDPERPNIAHGSLRIGESTIRTGRFERRAHDHACWLNDRSGERLCIW